MDVGVLVNILAAVVAGWVLLAPIVIPAVWMILRQRRLPGTISLALLIPLGGVLAVAWYLAMAAWNEERARVD